MIALQSQYDWYHWQFEEANPKKIKAGRVNKDPPPARVLITPAKNPIITRNTGSKAASIGDFKDTKTQFYFSFKRGG